jgi:hypothetical protein
MEGGDVTILRVITVGGSLDGNAVLMAHVGKYDIHFIVNVPDISFGFGFGSFNDNTRVSSEFTTSFKVIPFLPQPAGAPSVPPVEPIPIAY